MKLSIIKTQERFKSLIRKHIPEEVVIVGNQTEFNITYGGNTVTLGEDLGVVIDIVIDWEELAEASQYIDALALSVLTLLLIDKNLSVSETDRDVFSLTASDEFRLLTVDTNNETEMLDYRGDDLKFLKQMIGVAFTRNEPLIYIGSMITRLVSHLPSRFDGGKMLLTSDGIGLELLEYYENHDDIYYKVKTTQEEIGGKACLCIRHNMLDFFVKEMKLVHDLKRSNSRPSTKELELELLERTIRKNMFSGMGAVLIGYKHARTMDGCELYITDPENGKVTLHEPLTYLSDQTNYKTCDFDTYAEAVKENGNHTKLWELNRTLEECVLTLPKFDISRTEEYGEVYNEIHGLISMDVHSKTMRNESGGVIANTFGPFRKTSSGVEFDAQGQLDVFTRDGKNNDYTEDFHIHVKVKWV